MLGYSCFFGGSLEQLRRLGDTAVAEASSVISGRRRDSRINLVSDANQVMVMKQVGLSLAGVLCG